MPSPRSLFPFGELIRAARQNAGKNLRDVAEELGFTITYISDVERGNRPPFAPEIIARLARFLEVPVHTLIIAASQQRRAFTFELPQDASNSQLNAVAGFARGGLTDEQWDQIAKIVGNDD